MLANIFKKSFFNFFGYTCRQVVKLYPAGRITNVLFFIELCGKHRPDMYYTLDNQAWFSMDTDDSARYQGFELNYRAEKRIFTEPTGVLTSPLYPERYPTPVYTQYIIQVRNCIVWYSARFSSVTSENYFIQANF